MHPQVDGHLSSFQFLAIMNKPVMNYSLCGHMFLFLLGKFLEVELPGHIISIFLMQMNNC